MYVFYLGLYLYLRILYIAYITWFSHMFNALYIANKYINFIF